MSSVTDQYTKNYSKERKKKFEDRVKEIFDGSISEESVASMVAEEFRKGKKFGGLIDKPLGAGGKKSGPPPKRGPNPQGLNIKNNTVKTV